MCSCSLVILPSAQPTSPALRQSQGVPRGLQDPLCLISLQLKHSKNNLLDSRDVMTGCVTINHQARSPPARVTSCTRENIIQACRTAWIYPSGEGLGGPSGQEAP